MCHTFYYLFEYSAYLLMYVSSLLLLLLLLLLFRRPLYIAMTLCFVFMLVELAGGLIGHSLAIITDALHMLTDVFSFALAIYASIISNQASTRSFTFGFKRAEVLSALMSTLLIWVLTAVLMYEAVIRILQYNAGKMKDVDGRLMFFIAILGVGFNLVLERVLGDSGHGHSHGGHSHGHAHGHQETAPTVTTELISMHLT
jgi:solute carrier family 30 (zinc transporter), member 2